MDIEAVDVTINRRPHYSDYGLSLREFRKLQDLLMIKSPYYLRGPLNGFKRMKLILTIIEFAFLEKHYHEVCARYLASNPGSGRVMQKYGMVNYYRISIKKRVQHQPEKRTWSDPLSLTRSSITLVRTSPKAGNFMT